jgi:selenide, water dikinase
VLVDHTFLDDAAIVRVAPDRDLVLTVDVISPIVDDAKAFGAIAAANSLSDVWAMGGEPRFALNLVFFPDDSLKMSVLDEILEGGRRVCEEAGVSIVGGHSVRDPEIKYGLSVTGDVPRDQVWSNRSAQADQVLLVTKELGTGVIGQAIRKGLASEAATKAAINSMMMLNQSAARIGRKHGATSATDVTGFGLLGHLRNVLRGSNLRTILDLNSLLLLPDAVMHVRADLFPGGSKANRRTLAGDIAWEDGTPFAAEHTAESDREIIASLACDMQTSGGMMMSVPKANADACLGELRDAGLPAAAIGTLHPSDPALRAITLRA